MKPVKGDNRGFSLIEVLVAVIILAIVVAPFLHSFFTTTSANAKAKNIHKATIVAQSVMEGLKAETLENIALQYNYPGQGFYIIDANRIGGGVAVSSLVEELSYNSVTGTYTAVAAPSTVSLDGGATSEFRGQSSGVYYFSMEKVREDISGYDVLVKLDASAYRAGVVSDVDDAHKYNSDMLAQLPVIDLGQDAMSVQKENYEDMAVSEFMLAFPTVSEVTIRNDMKRVITVDVEKARVGANDRVVVNIEYLYRFTDSGVTKQYKKEQVGYDSNQAEKDLRSVYLYYYPLYSSGASRDSIVFKNNGKLPVNFYLMKQQSATATVADETGYNAVLSFEEPGAVAGNMQAKVYTNMGTNLVDGNTIGTPFYSIFLNGSSVELGDVASSGAVLNKKSDRMFEIEVSVYQVGAKDAGFPSDMWLTTLEGSAIK